MRGPAKCFKHNSHCGCSKGTACEFSMTEYKTRGGVDWAVKLHCAPWGGIRWDDNGSPTKPLDTVEKVVAYMAQIRQQVAKKFTKQMKESEGRAAKEAGKAEKALVAAAAAKETAAARTRDAEKLKEAGGDPFVKAVAAQKEAQRVAAARSKDAEDGKSGPRVRPKRLGS